MAKKTQSPPASFEDALKELEQILTDIETGNVTLEQSIVKFERGNFLIDHCRVILDGAEKQIEILSKGKDDQLKSEPMDDDDDEE